MSPAAARSLATTFGDAARTLVNLAVAVQPEKQRVHICVRNHHRDPITGEPTATYEVLVDGEIYHVRDRELHALQDGVSPEELGLDPVEDEGRL